MDYKPSESINCLCERHKIGFLHVLSYGIDNGVLSSVCKTGVSAIFDMSKPYGDVYTGVSEYLCRKFNQRLCVPHIVRKYEQTEDIRVIYGIPKDAFVVGRHGGYTEFNIPFVKDAVVSALSARSDIYFLFLCTEKFIDHQRAIFINWLRPGQAVANFIHACDAMLHARMIGETFGLSVAEFSSACKPILTWDGGPLAGLNYDTAHIDHLGQHAVLYSNQNHLEGILYDLSRTDCLNLGVDCFSDIFSEVNVMDTYERVFLNKESNVQALKKISMQSTVHAAQWLKWLGHLSGVAGVAGLEIGTFQGESAEWMMDNVFTNRDSVYYCVDPFTGSDDLRASNVDCSQTERDTRTRLNRFPQHRIIKNYSCVALKKFEPLSLDFCYIDGSHTSNDVLRDAVLAFDALKISGIMIFDDVEWEAMPRQTDRPKIAVEAFVSTYADYLQVLEPRGWQVAVKKTMDRLKDDAMLNDPELNQIFDKNGSDKGHNCHHYGRVYGFLLQRLRDKQVKILEIGVYNGASLRSWADYFRNATIVGVDIKCDFKPTSERINIEIGDSSDITFLSNLIKKHGAFDIIIDDGSHRSSDQQIAFKALWPYLNSGGVYVVEDLEVSYHPNWQHEDYIQTMEYFKAKATKASICVGGKEPWILFANELIAVFKP